ncbi:MAG: hypothetical protein IRY85_18680 [Micromonosporaceae bacterium]|nr:hypothetical protein [Micromonosporaceae bacterium]
MTAEGIAALAAACLLAFAVWWVDSRALRDLASTPDHQLLRFDRRTWVLLILFLFPIGAMLYLMYGKAGPGRYS